MKHHTSPETALVVNDYPYGFKLRCNIRYWIEDGGKKGFRFVSQTSNPKKDNLVWNKEKKGNYAKLAMCLFLDAEGHVSHTALSEYDGAERVLSFLNEHGKDAHFVSDFATFLSLKERFSTKLANDEAFFTVNGVRQEKTAEEKERHAKDAALWKKCLETYSSLV